MIKSVRGTVRLLISGVALLWWTTAASGQVGPDLTHFGNRGVIGAGVLTNTPEHLATWIRNPGDVKPGVLMPGYNLSNDDLQALVSFLESLK